MGRDGVRWGAVGLGGVSCSWRGGHRQRGERSLSRRAERSNGTREKRRPSQAHDYGFTHLPTSRPIPSARASRLTHPVNLVDKDAKRHKVLEGLEGDRSRGGTVIPRLVKPEGELNVLKVELAGIAIVVIHANLLPAEIFTLVLAVPLLPGLLNLVAPVEANLLAPGCELLPLIDAKLPGRDAPEEEDGHVDHALELLLELLPHTGDSEEDCGGGVEEGDPERSLESRGAAEPNGGAAGERASERADSLGDVAEGEVARKVVVGADPHHLGKRFDDRLGILVRDAASFGSARGPARVDQRVEIFDSDGGHWVWSVGCGVWGGLREFQA